MRWLTLLALLAGCAFPTPASGDAGRPAPSGSSGRMPDLSRLDRAVDRATNAARQSEGVGALRWSDDLAAVARAHSRDMAERGYFDHVAPDGSTPQDRAVARGVECVVQVGGGRTRVGVAENLYQGWRYGRVWTRRSAEGVTREYEWLAPSEIARETVEGWLDSPGHRRNLLDPVSTSHGIGVATDPEARVYVTQVLC